MLLGRTKVTMQYPEEKWDDQMPSIIAVRPPWSAIPMVVSVALPVSFVNSSVRRAPSRLWRARFHPPIGSPSREVPGRIRYRYDPLHFCGMCEEVVPSRQFFAQGLRHHRFTRKDMVHDKNKLLEIGGVMHGVVLKGTRRNERRFQS